MKNLLISLIAALMISSSALAASKTGKTEDWKGPSDDARVQLGGMGGLAILGDTLPAAQITGFAAFRVTKRGFIEDINNAVWAELQIGPAFSAPGIGLVFTPAIRWDFHKDDFWSLYGLGGIGGNVFVLGTPGSRLALFPRFAVGALFRVNWMTFLRAELSHEFIGLGAGVSF